MNDIEGVRMILNNDPDDKNVNLRDSFGRTILDNLVMNVDPANRRITVSTILFLLEHGTNIENRDEDGNTPLNLSVKCFPWFEEIIELLLDHDADINTVGQNGFTPIMWAAEMGSEIRVGLLLRRGADISIKNNNGFTAEEIALERNWHKIVAQIQRFRERERLRTIKKGRAFAMGQMDEKSIVYLLTDLALELILDNLKKD